MNRLSTLASRASVSSLLVASSLVALLLAADATRVRAQTGSSGVVRGSVEIGVATTDEPPSLSPYATRRYRPPAGATSGEVTVDDVVVYVLASSDTRAPAGATAEITQRDRTIIPRLTVVAAGTTIEFPNEDDIFHNLFSLSDANPFNLGRYPPGESRSELFDEPGIVRMFCDIHSEMTGVIRVLDSTHFVRPEPDGSFVLRDVPSGTHSLVVWHDALGADTTRVVVSSSREATVEVRLGG